MNPLRSVFLALSRTPPALMLIIIIGIAAVVTMAVTNDQNSRKRDLDLTIADMQHKANAKTKIVYAVKDIPEGALIQADNLEEKEIELSRAPMDAVANSSMAIGRNAKFGIQAGQIVSTHDLAAQGVQLGFESRLKPGHRAVTFAVDSNSGVAGFINPNSRVDIMGMVGSGADTKVAPILSDVEIIAVGQMFEKQSHTTAATPASSVTVAVNPVDTQKLIKAVAASKIYLSLRNGNDHTPVTTVDVTSLFPVKEGNSAIAANRSELPALTSLPPLLPFDAAPTAQIGNGAMAGNSVAPIAPAPPPLHEIEIWTGGKKDLVSVPRS